MLRFSAQKLSQLRDTQALLMSPLSFPTDREWCLAVLRSVKDLLEVDMAHMALAHGPTPLLLTEDFDPRLFDVLGVIGSREGIMEFSDDNVNATQRLAADTHLKVYDTRQVLQEATGRRLEDTQLYQEFIEPLGAVDPITIQVGLPGGTALVAVGHRRKDRAMTPETEEWYLAQLLASALEAGANVLVRYWH